MRTPVSTRQIFIVSLVSVIGFGIFATSSIGASYMSTGAWISILCAGIIFARPAIFLTTLSRKHDGDTIFSYSQKIVGNLAGKLFSAIYAVFYLLFCAFALSYFSHIVSMWILPNTSFRFIAIFIVLVCAYALSRGFTSVIRLVSFLGTLVVFTVIIIRIIMIFSGDAINLLPIFEKEVVIKGFIKGTSAVSVFFFGVGVLGIIPHNKNAKGSVFASMGGVLVSSLVLILVCLSCFSMLGPLRTGMYFDAVALSMKAFDISRVTFIQRADIIFIITWALLMLCAICLISHIPYAYIKALLPKNKKSLGEIAVCVPVFIIAALLPNMEYAVDYLNILCMTLGIGALFIIPLILFVAEVRNEKKK